MREFLYKNIKKNSSLIIHSLLTLSFSCILIFKTFFLINLMDRNFGRDE